MYFGSSKIDGLDAHDGVEVDSLSRDDSQTLGL